MQCQAQRMCALSHKLENKPTCSKQATRSAGGLLHKSYLVSFISAVQYCLQMLRTKRRETA